MVGCLGHRESGFRTNLSRHERKVRIYGCGCRRAVDPLRAATASIQSAASIASPDIVTRIGTGMRRLLTTAWSGIAVNKVPMAALRRVAQPER
jgi:hypothetical protein